MTSTAIAATVDARVARLLPPSAAPAHTFAIQGALALNLDGAVTPDRAPGAHLVSVPTESSDPADVPPCQPWAGRFGLAVIDVLQGDRSPQQLVRCTSRRVHDDLVRRAAAINRASTPEQRRTRLRASIRSVHAFCPTPTAAEVAIHIRQGLRGRAIAARLELVSGRWVCTALEFG